MATPIHSETEENGWEIHIEDGIFVKTMHFMMNCLTKEICSGEETSMMSLSSMKLLLHSIVIQDKQLMIAGQPQITKLCKLRS